MRLLREAYLAEVAAIAAERLVVVDESGCTTSMTRTRGRAPRGQRVHDAVPGGHWKVTTLIGAVRVGGVAAAVSVEARRTARCSSPSSATRSCRPFGRATWS